MFCVSWKVAEALVAGKTLEVALQSEASDTAVKQLVASCPTFSPSPNLHPSSTRGTLPFRGCQTCPEPPCFEEGSLCHTQFDQFHFLSTPHPQRASWSRIYDSHGPRATVLSPLRADHEGQVEHTCPEKCSRVPSRNLMAFKGKVRPSGLCNTPVKTKPTF